eukprot:scaffold3607_cov114-Isochrysis_galbana.AAC.14
MLVSAAAVAAEAVAALGSGAERTGRMGRGAEDSEQMDELSVEVKSGVSGGGPRSRCLRWLTGSAPCETPARAPPSKCRQCASANSPSTWRNQTRRLAASRRRVGAAVYPPAPPLPLALARAASSGGL